MIGVVLAGGSSRRFQGRAKGLLLLHGVPLVLYAARALMPLCSRVVIECARDEGYEALGLPVVHASSENAGKGPLAGIAAGLGLATSDEKVAFVPCDMPLLTSGVYGRLAREASGSFATSPMGVEPLVCVLTGQALPEVERLLAEKSVPGVLALFEATGAAAVAFDDPSAFLNVNTPEELTALNARNNQ
ncbi:MAG: NTP transferase domain-containing protein [Micropepsaceae bacterium]